MKKNHGTVHVWSIEHSQTSLKDQLVLSNPWKVTILSQKFDYLVKVRNCLGQLNYLYRKLSIVYKHHIGLAAFGLVWLYLYLLYCLVQITTRKEINL